MASTSAGPAPATAVAAPDDDPPTQKSPSLSVDRSLDDLMKNELAALEAPGDSHPPASRPFVTDAVAAIRKRDFRALDAAITRAEANHAKSSAVSRLRAVADLARGDVTSARQRLAVSIPDEEASATARARHQLALALLNLRDGAPVPGVRAGLAALAASRSAADPRGEAAALQLLAACYRALGRHEDANRLESLL